MPTIRLLSPGSLSNFSRNGEGRAFGLNHDNGGKIPLVRRPMELIAGSAIGFPCVTTALDEILDSFIIPAGMLGVNSVLQIEPVWSYTNSANNKILKVKIGTTTVYTATRTTSVKEAPLIILANRNSLYSQIRPYDGSYVTAGTVASVSTTIDFSVDQILSITGQRANAGDTLRLEYYRVLHFIGF